MKKILFIFIIVGLAYTYAQKKNLFLDEKDMFKKVIETEEDNDKILKRSDIVNQIYREENAELIRKAEEKRLADFKNSYSYKRDLEAMTMALYHEARGENTKGIEFVADVIINRTLSKKFWKNGKMVKNFPDNIPEVIKNCEFSFYCDGKSDAMPSAWQKNRVRNIAEERILARLFYKKPALTNAFFYHTTAVNGGWFKDVFSKKFASQYRKIIVGNHIFYEAYSGTKLASL